MCVCTQRETSAHMPKKSPRIYAHTHDARDVCTHTYVVVHALLPGVDQVPSNMYVYRTVRVFMSNRMCPCTGS